MCEEIQFDEECKNIRVYFERTKEFKKAYYKLAKYVDKLGLSSKEDDKLSSLIIGTIKAAERSGYKQGFSDYAKYVRIEISD